MLNNHYMNESDSYRYLVLSAQNIAILHGYDIINWYNWALYIYLFIFWLTDKGPNSH